MSELAGLKGQRIAAPGPGSRSGSAGNTQHCRGAGPGTGVDRLWLEQPAVVLVIVLPNNSPCGHIQAIPNSWFQCIQPILKCKKARYEHGQVPVVPQHCFIGKTDARPPYHDTFFPRHNVLGTSMPSSPVWTSWVAEPGLLPQKVPAAWVHMNESGDNPKNLNPNYR